MLVENLAGYTVVSEISIKHIFSYRNNFTTMEEIAITRKIHPRFAMTAIIIFYEICEFNF